MAETQKPKEKKECKHCKTYENQLEELKDLMQRVQADFENHKKRADKEKGEIVKYANQKIILDLLPALDSFEAALANSDEGVKILYAQIMNILKTYGVKKMETKEQQFNPDMHEAMFTEEGEEDDIITDELQSGYVMNDLVVRPAKVKISKKKQETKDDNKKNSSKKNN